MGCECGRKKKQTSGAERVAVQLRKLVLPKALTQCKIIWWVIGDIDILCKINWRVYRFEGQNNLIFACNLMWRSTDAKFSKPGSRAAALMVSGFSASLIFCSKIRWMTKTPWVGQTFTCLSRPSAFPIFRRVLVKGSLQVFRFGS